MIKNIDIIILKNQENCRKPFKNLFTMFKSLAKFIIAPLNIILGIFDAGFEAKDAVEKSVK